MHMNFKAITAGTLAALIASTSLASAAGGGIVIKPQQPKPPVSIVDPDHYKPIHIPIDISQPKPKPIQIIPSDPIVNKPVFKPVGGGKPNIPVIPIPLDADAGGKAGDGVSPVLALACTVADPLVNGDSFWIVNAGNVALPVGLKIRYRVHATGDHGAFLLPRQVAVGGKLLIPNLLHGAAEGARCKAEIIT
jgi:hypothetical protein